MLQHQFMAGRGRGMQFLYNVCTEKKGFSTYFLRRGFWGITIQQKSIHGYSGHYEAPRDELQRHAATGENVVVGTVNVNTHTPYVQKQIQSRSEHANAIRAHVQCMYSRYT